MKHKGKRVIGALLIVVFLTSCTLKQEEMAKAPQLTEQKDWNYAFHYGSDYWNYSSVYTTDRKPAGSGRLVYGL